MYWYDNNLFFKDVCGGLKLIYIMNYVYMLKDLIGKIYRYEELISKNRININTEIVRMLENYQELLGDFKKF